MAGVLRREHPTRTNRRGACADGTVLLVPRVDARLVLAPPLGLKQANNSFVLELLADRPHQDRAQRRLQTTQKKDETPKCNMRSVKRCRSRRARLQYWRCPLRRANLRQARYLSSTTTKA